MSGVSDHFMTALSNEMRGFVPFYFDRIVPLVSSPIEAHFGVAFFIISLLRNDPAVIIAQNGPLGASAGRRWFVEPQFNLLSYRADFLIGPLPRAEHGNLVVECDGHDFHERTKEQAEHDRRRDREMQAAGYKVFRFTGAEIYRDPFRCAGEVFNELLRATRS